VTAGAKYLWILNVLWISDATAVVDIEGGFPFEGREQKQTPVHVKDLAEALLFGKNNSS
jgi:hypothetical protein